jgi:hypothetical protein
LQALSLVREKTKKTWATVMGMVMLIGQLHAGTMPGMRT